MAFVLFLALFASTTIAYTNGYIVVFGDVHKDVEFFTRTWPWIIDNIGGNLFVDYYLLGSGRYSVPQSCALREVQGNTFLQAQYLRCEALGYPSEYCLCEAGINPEYFKQCVVSGGDIAGEAQKRYSALDVNYTPVVDIWGMNNTAIDKDDISLLNRICNDIFTVPSHKPRGCTHYSSQTEGFLEQKALAQFDRKCSNEFPLPIPTEMPETPITPEMPKPWHDDKYV